MAAGKTSTMLRVRTPDARGFRSSVDFSPAAKTLRLGFHRGELSLRFKTVSQDCPAYDGGS